MFDKVYNKKSSLWHDTLDKKEKVCPHCHKTFEYDKNDIDIRQNGIFSLHSTLTCPHCREDIEELSDQEKAEKKKRFIFSILSGIAVYLAVAFTIASYLS